MATEPLRRGPQRAPGGERWLQWPALYVFPVHAGVKYSRELSLEGGKNDLPDEMICKTSQTTHQPPSKPRRLSYRISTRRKYTRASEEPMAKNYWLIKSEPSDYSFDDLMSEEDQISEWDGVRNYQARNNMQAMTVGDGVFFYHSQAKPTAVVGTAVVVEEAYPDDTAWDPKSQHPDPKSTPENPVWFMVDIKGQERLSRPVTLQEIKKTPGLENMALVKSSRLSVQPVSEDEWQIVREIASQPDA